METQFEVGRWYYADSYYGKFKEFKHNLFYCDESINSNYKYIFHIGGHFSEDWAKFCVLVDNSKVEQFLPDGHVDKFTTKLEYVKCIRAGHTEYEVGKIYKVEDDRRVRNRVGYLPSDGLPLSLKNFYTNYDFTPSTKEEFDKQNQEWIPQVGDWVVLQKSEDNWATDMNKLVDKCVQITDINKTYTTSIEFKERDGYSWCLEDKHFRKALPHEIPDNFVLPEKWCIKQSAGEESCKWFNEKYGVTSHVGGSYNYLLNPKFQSSCYHTSIPDSYTEITFEQFKKYVLKEENNEDIIVPFDSLWKQMSKKSSTESSEIHIPELIRHDKTQVKVVTDLSYPKITINIISKESKKVNPVTIKQTKISLK